MNQAPIYRWCYEIFIYSNWLLPESYIVIVCYGQYYFTSLTLTTPIENGWQDTTNRRRMNTSQAIFFLLLFSFCYYIIFVPFQFNLVIFFVPSLT